MKAVLISVGDEVLCGDVVNTNCAYLARELSSIGYNILYHEVIPDEPEIIARQIQSAAKITDLIVTVGGLGPTKDDLTKQSVARALDVELYMNEDLAAEMRKFFARHGSVMTENNLQQCMIPRGSFVLGNVNGTAPGVFYEKDGVMVANLPGPPREMIPMYENHLKTLLREHADFEFAEKYYMSSGIGESALESRLRDELGEIAGYTYNTYLSQCGVMVKAIGYGENKKGAQALVERYDACIKECLGQYLYAEKRCEIWECVAEALIRKNLSIASAESCTGGLFASMLTKTPGISSVYPGSVVSYSNEIKMKSLGVKPETLKRFGAVSEQTAHEMAAGARRYFGTDIGVGITGIAGPDGATKDKPVGLVYIGVDFKGECKVTSNIFNGTRETVQQRSMTRAFVLLNEFVKKH